MDFGLSAAEAARAFNIKSDEHSSPGRSIDLYNGTTAVSEIGFSDALAKVVRTIETDPAMLANVVAMIGADRLRAALTKPQSVAPFPLDPGTIECSIWDNQPFAKATRTAGDKSRERPARFGVTLKAHVKGVAKPITSQPDFKATGDLFTPDEIRTRLKKTWKDIDPDDRAILEDSILPSADSNGTLIARLFLSRKGCGKHWHKGHFLMIDAAGLQARDMHAAILMAGDKFYQLAPFSKLDGTGDPFPVTERATKSGGKKISACILQSRSSDHASLRRSWITGEVR